MSTSHFSLTIPESSIDLNMGCPDKNVLKTGAGADLIKSPQLAQELIVAAKKAVGEEYPISVKTRIGYNVPEVDDWVRNILDVEPSALTLHLRTRKELSLVPARWTSDIIGRAAEINKKEYKGRTLLIGNGDITSYDEAMQKVAEFGLDGIMIGSSSADSRLHTQSLQELPTYNLPILCAGRATFGQPFMFTGRRGTLQERLRVMVEHTKLFDELMLPFQPISLMRKFYRAYVYGFHDAKTWRTKMMLAANTAEVEMHVEELIARLDSGEIEEDPNAPIPLRTS
jgi:tRNA-dihydrouridine synthase